ncbi:uncharacterized protein LOC143198476 isoform X1 [Rhynchophorus ferrugineus]|uniref:uncharacterized protein LOC143198476 isoform X1 n=1 Tax=Rhynchophorus ferrugineus TaxID=354439 RepID=UPI003FCCCC09
MSLSQRETEKRFGRPKQITVWENGDFYNDGHMVLINPSHYRTWNGVLSMITDTLKPSIGAIRHLVHLNSKEIVTSFEQLLQNEKYIATGNERLKEARNAYKSPAEKTVENHQSHKYYLEQSPSNAGYASRGLRTILFVMANGKTEEMPCKMVLTESDVESWDTTKDYIARSLDIPEGIQYLYTIFGDVIDNPRDIQNGCIYVAVATNDKFISIDYPKVFSTLLPMREINMERSRTNSDAPPLPRHYPSATKQKTEIMKSKNIKQTQSNETPFQRSNYDKLKPIAVETPLDKETPSPDHENIYSIQTSPMVTKMFTNCASIGITKKSGGPRNRLSRRYCCSPKSPPSKTANTTPPAIKENLGLPNTDAISLDLTLDAIEKVKSGSIKRNSVATSSVTETHKSDMKIQADIVTKTDQDMNVTEKDLKRQATPISEANADISNKGKTKDNPSLESKNSDAEAQVSHRTGSFIEKQTNTYQKRKTAKTPSLELNNSKQQTSQFHNVSKPAPNRSTRDISPLKFDPSKNLQSSEITNINGVDIFKQLEDLDLESQTKRSSNKTIQSLAKEEYSIMSKKTKYCKSNEKASAVKSTKKGTIMANTKKNEREVIRKRASNSYINGNISKNLLKNKTNIEVSKSQIQNKGMSKLLAMAPFNSDPNPFISESLMKNVTSLKSIKSDENVPKLSKNINHQNIPTQNTVTKKESKTFIENKMGKGKKKEKHTSEPRSESVSVSSVLKKSHTLPIISKKSGSSEILNNKNGFETKTSSINKIKISQSDLKEPSSSHAQCSESFSISHFLKSLPDNSVEKPSNYEIHFKRDALNSNIREKSNSPESHNKVGSQIKTSSSSIKSKTSSLKLHTSDIASKSSSSSSPFNKSSPNITRKHQNLSEPEAIPNILQVSRDPNNAFCNHLCSSCCKKPIPDRSSVKVNDILKENSRELMAGSQLIHPIVNPKLTNINQGSSKNIQSSTKTPKPESPSHLKMTSSKLPLEESKVDSCRSSVSIKLNESKSRKLDDIDLPPTENDKTKSISNALVTENESNLFEISKSKEEKEIDLLPSKNDAESCPQDLRLKSSTNLIPEHESVIPDVPPLNEQDVFNLPSPSNNDVEIAESTIQELKKSSSNDLIPVHESIVRNVPILNKQDGINVSPLPEDDLIEVSSRNLEKALRSEDNYDEQEESKLPVSSKNYIKVSESSSQNAKEPEHETDTNPYPRYCNSLCNYCCKPPTIADAPEKSDGESNIHNQEYIKADSKKSSCHSPLNDSIHTIENIHQPDQVLENNYRKNSCLGQFLKAGKLKFRCVCIDERCKCITKCTRFCEDKQTQTGSSDHVLS